MREPHKEVGPGKRGKEAADKDVNDLHLEPSDALDHSKWIEIIRGNWSDGNCDRMPRAEYKLYVSCAILPRLT